MERNVRLVIAYDGTEYHGWQRQPELRTVQGMIEQAARRVLRHHVVSWGAGRTDAGVHAAGQVANFFTGSAIPAEKLGHAIGGRLPKDIAICRVDDVAAPFNASRSAVSKLYRYSIYNARARPVDHRRNRFTYHFWQPLDLDAMREAAAAMMGEQDFAAMASKGCHSENTVRTVLRLDLYRVFEEVHIDVEGTGFLYNQVRNMVGTLIEVGRGHWPPEKVAQILLGRDRTQAGPTAPARGLCLQWVRYDPRILHPEPGGEPGGQSGSSFDACPETT